MSLHELPPDLPIPRDDGACAHLATRALPDVPLATTSGELVNPGKIPGPVVLYVYPLSGRPGHALPDGWDAIPGARGCTPEACGFRDHHADLTAHGATVFGLSAQSPEYQREFRDRLGLPFHLLSDEDFDFAKALVLPTFEAGSLRLLRRVTLIAQDSKIVRIFYPVFPPDRHAEKSPPPSASLTTSGPEDRSSSAP